MKWIFLLVGLAFAGGSSLAVGHSGGEKAQARSRSADPWANVKDTALGDFIDENGGMPLTLPALREAIDKTYGFSRSTVVPFSAAPGYTDLVEARTVYFSPAGDLYIGAIHREEGTDFEFISRNKLTNKFDFGVIRDFGTAKARAEIVDKKNCTICHKNEGPHFYTFPWLNTLARSPGAGAAIDSKAAKNLALHIAFLEVASKSDPGLRHALEMTKDIQEHGGGLSADQSKFTFLSGVRYQGADLLADAKEIEEAAYLGNQITYLHELFPKMDAKERRLLLSFLLNVAICDGPKLNPNGPLSPDSGDPRFQAFEEQFRRQMLLGGTNRSVLINPIAFSHLASSKDAIANFSTVESIRKMHKKKRAQHLRNTLPDESPILAENFLDVRPNLGRNTYASVGGSNMIGAYRASLRLPPTSHSAFCESTAIEKLKDSDHLPNRQEVMAAIRAFSKSGASTAKKKPEGEVKNCMDCHRGQIAGITAPFDLGSLKAWRENLNANDPAVVAKARRWLRKANSSDVFGEGDGRMPPPPHHSHLSEAEREEIRT